MATSTSDKQENKRGAVATLVLLGLTFFAGITLFFVNAVKNQNQDIRSRASSPYGPSCIEKNQSCGNGDQGDCCDGFNCETVGSSRLCLQVGILPSPSPSTLPKCGRDSYCAPASVTITGSSACVENSVNNIIINCCPPDKIINDHKCVDRTCELVSGTCQYGRSCSQDGKETINGTCSYGSYCCGTQAANYSCTHDGVTMPEYTSLCATPYAQMVIQCIKGHLEQRGCQENTFCDPNQNRCVPKEQLNLEFCPSGLACAGDGQLVGATKCISSGQIRYCCSNGEVIHDNKCEAKTCADFGGTCQYGRSCSQDGKERIDGACSYGAYCCGTQAANYSCTHDGVIVPEYTSWCQSPFAPEVSQCVKGVIEVTSCNENTVCDPNRNKCVSKDAIEIPAEYQNTQICSIDGWYSLNVTADGQIDWSRSNQCIIGCDHGSCINEKVIVIGTCHNGTRSPDGLEECVDGFFLCFPGSIRPPLTTPGQSNQSEVTWCNTQRQWETAKAETDKLYKDNYCEGNSVYKKTAIFSKTLIKSCSENEICVSSDFNSKIKYADCYKKGYLKSLVGCLPGGYIKIGDEEVSCDKITSTLDSTRMIIEELYKLQGRSCDSRTANTVFDGNVLTSNGLMHCTFDCSEQGKVVINKCDQPATIRFTDPFCSGSKVVAYSAAYHEEPAEIMDCGYKRVCPVDASSVGCLNEALCQNGTCKQETGNACQNPNEVKPNVDPTAPNTYVICDGSTHTWQLVAHGASIQWKDCPTSFIDMYMQTIGKTNNNLVTDKGFTFECHENYSAAGDLVLGVVYSDPKQGVVAAHMACDPVASPADCSETLVHEMMHIWQVDQDELSHDASNESYNETIWCKEDSTNVGTYLFDGEKPVSSYGYTNCSEALAEAASHYVYRSCEMKANYSKQYNWFLKDDASPFKGVEYCKEP